MTVGYNVDLYKYNTMRLHSIAETVYFPENKEELQTLIIKLQSNNKGFHLLSAGSNVILSENISTPIICLMNLDNSIEINDCSVSCGCSVRIQTLVRTLQSNGLGGLEYLFSVPASVGGAVYMNAGRGQGYNKAISDYLEKVEYLDLKTQKYKEVMVDKSLFSHRHSIFQDFPCIITKIYFKFPNQDSTKTEQLIKERLAYSKNKLDAGKPSCGSVFSKGNPVLFRLFKGMRCNGAKFSNKTSNWISNVNNATASDIRKLVNKAFFFHKLLLSKYKLEIRFFD
jgi:UDP-N-acetylmuramate dehydrogenase